jgi:hypothetical protein
MALKQIIKKKAKTSETLKHELDILGPGIADLIDDNSESILMPKNLGPTDYSSLFFNADYESKDIKGYGSFSDYLDIKEFPAEIFIDEEIAW